MWHWRRHVVFSLHRKARSSPSGLSIHSASKHAYIRLAGAAMKDLVTTLYVALQLYSVQQPAS